MDSGHSFGRKLDGVCETYDSPILRRDTKDSTEDVDTKDSTCAVLDSG